MHLNDQKVKVKLYMADVARALEMCFHLNYTYWLMNEVIYMYIFAYVWMKPDVYLYVCFEGIGCDYNRSFEAANIRTRTVL